MRLGGPYTTIVSFLLGLQACVRPVACDFIEVLTDKVGRSSECLIANLTRLQMVYRVMWNPDFTSRFLTFEYCKVAGTTA